jgi:hypothetical protein
LFESKITNLVKKTMKEVKFTFSCLQGLSIFNL